MHLSPGKEKILKVLQEAGENGLSFKELREKTGLAGSILSHYLQQLLDDSMIEKLWRKYRVLDEGREALSIRDDILLISRTKKVIRKELLPNPEKIAPRIFPIDVSIHLSPEIEKLLDLTREDLEFTKGPPISKEELYETLLGEIAEPIAAHFDTMFITKFYSLTQDLLAYDIQQMQPAERRDFLSRLHQMELPIGRDATTLERRKRTLDFYEDEYMRQKFPPEGPSLTFESLLDFEGAVIAHVSREKLKKDQDNIRNRFTAYMLAATVNRLLAQPPHFVYTMMKAGMITPEEYEKYRQAKGSKNTKRVLRHLLKKYYTLAWGERPRERIRIHRVSRKILKKRQRERQKLALKAEQAGKTLN